MRDKKYIKQMKELNDYTWREHEKYLYYSYKNQDYIIPIIIFAFFGMFTTPYGIDAIISVLLFGYSLCWCNNKDLDNNPRVLEKREEYRKWRRETLGMNV